MQILFLLSCYECSLNTVHISDPVSVIGALQKLKLSLTSPAFFRQILAFLADLFSGLSADGVLDARAEKSIGMILSLLANLLMIRDEYQVNGTHLLHKHLHVQLCFVLLTFQRTIL